jgi:cytochrome c oxidase subunit 1
MAESVPHEVSVGHDDHHDHHDPSFLQKYVFSTDHKMIAMQYMFTGMAMGLVGAFMAYAFRMQLAFPGESVPGFGLVTPANYNALVTNTAPS